ncbi:GNAT family N-acetyltransferase [Candidatus Hydrogenedentota bacterium]
MSSYTLRPMTISDYDNVTELWQRTENICLHDSDSREPMERFLKRNPSFSSVAGIGNQIVGAVLCSHDGRRGYLHHLAVEKSFRRQGIGRSLVNRSMKILADENIHRCNIFILEDNDPGIQFWQNNKFVMLEHFGWMQRKTDEQV